MSPPEGGFDPALALQEVNNPGYHTLLPAGGQARHTRENARLALRLIGSSADTDRERARRILAALLAVQDTDPGSATYGTWPWYFEEPLASMSPPDLNWADFIGAIFLTLLARHGDQLDGELKAGMRSSLRHAALCIRKRDVGPQYTNIAVMGATVTAGAGELLGDAALLDYGRQRLARFVAYTRAQGGFNEYNSPTYTWVALQEVERALATVRDADTRACVTSLHEDIWAAIAPFFHPGTQQWAGPHSRVYHDHLTPEGIAGLNLRLGTALKSRDPRPPRQTVDDDLAVPCPAHLKPRFSALPTATFSHRQTFIRYADGSAAVRGEVWMDGTACLGTVNVDSLWVQRRPFLAYWRTPEDPAVVLRLRCLRDGRDWASAALHTCQAGPNALAAFGMLRDAGDFHLMLDRPSNGRFVTRQLSLVCSLEGRGITGHQLGSDLWELSAGGSVASIRTAPVFLAGQPVGWRLASSATGVRLHATLDFPEPTALDPASLDPSAAIALALGSQGSPHPPPPLLVTPAPGGLRWTCGPHEVLVPATLPSFRIHS